MSLSRDYSTCCCGSIKIEFGAAFVGCLYLLGSIGQIITAFVVYLGQISIVTPIIVNAVATILSALCLFVGIQRRLSTMVLPLMLIQLLNFLGIIGLAIFFVIALSSPSTISDSSDYEAFRDISDVHPTANKFYQQQVAYGVGLGACILSMLLCSWFMAITSACYQHFGGSATCCRQRVDRQAQWSTPPFRSSPPPSFAHFQPTPPQRRKY
uniref:MARVEL domain-containing protein n=1 Tax=Steinernema glaseri TaxID=37863 RepID=A0A1I7ZQ04_9BILA